MRRQVEGSDGQWVVHDQSRAVTAAVFRKQTDVHKKIGRHYPDPSGALCSDGVDVWMPLDALGAPGGLPPAVQAYRGRARSVGAKLLSPPHGGSEKGKVYARSHLHLVLGFSLHHASERTSNIGDGCEVETGAILRLQSPAARVRPGRHSQGLAREPPKHSKADQAPIQAEAESAPSSAPRTSDEPHLGPTTVSGMPYTVGMDEQYPRLPMFRPGRGTTPSTEWADPWDAHGHARSPPVRRSRHVCPLPGTVRLAGTPEAIPSFWMQYLE